MQSSMCQITTFLSQFCNSCQFDLKQTDFMHTTDDGRIMHELRSPYRIKIKDKSG